MTQRRNAAEREQAIQAERAAALDRRCTLLAGRTGVVVDLASPDWSNPEAGVVYHIVLDTGEQVACTSPKDQVELGPLDAGAAWWRARAEGQEKLARRLQDLLVENYSAQVERTREWQQAMLRAGLDVHIY